MKKMSLLHPSILNDNSNTFKSRRRKEMKANTQRKR